MLKCKIYTVAKVILMAMNVIWITNNVKLLYFTCCQKLKHEVVSPPWLVWLRGLNTGLWTQKVTGSIPSQGTCLGCEPGPQLGAYERQPITVSLTHWYFSPILSLFLPLSIKSLKKKWDLLSRINLR